MKVEDNISLQNLAQLDPQMASELAKAISDNTKFKFGFLKPGERVVNTVFKGAVKAR